MSLNEINLSPYLLHQLYEKNLVVEKARSGTEKKGVPKNENLSSGKEWQALGEFKKQILIGVNYSDVKHLPDEQLDFLLKLLDACRFSLSDVAVVNLNNYKNISYQNILEHFNTKTILLFGISTAQFGFPFEIPQYQVQSFDGRIVMHAPNLQDLQNDKPGKSKTWSGLKTIFTI